MIDAKDEVKEELERLKKRIEDLERRPVFVPFPAYPTQPAPTWPWLGEPFTYGPTFTCAAKPDALHSVT